MHWKVVDFIRVLSATHTDPSSHSFFMQFVHYSIKCKRVDQGCCIWC